MNKNKQIDKQVNKTQIVDLPLLYITQPYIFYAFFSYDAKINRLGHWP